ncbi:hypothetical protein ADL03_01620 [Nocardia sp. NRRL S-836]|nr:hypothetical protein ADL03_01620 [Nocardia sp. NRRL S-836]
MQHRTAPGDDLAAHRAGRCELQDDLRHVDALAGEAVDHAVEVAGDSDRGPHRAGVVHRMPPAGLVNTPTLRRAEGPFQGPRSRPDGGPGRALTRPRHR